MKQGKKSIVELAQELSRIHEVKKDFLVPTSKLAMNENAEIEFESPKAGKVAFGLTDWSLGQVAAHTDIPKAYVERLGNENKALLAQNVNHGFKRNAEARAKDGRLVRTLDGKIRGFMSSSYRMLDGYDLLDAIMPTLVDKKFEVVSSEITEKRLYVKTSSAAITGEVKKGDVIQYGVMISTSDVGAGALKIEPYLNRLVCTNGMISSTSFKQAHFGRNQFEQHIQEILSDNTKRLNDAAFFNTVRDYMLNTMKKDVFEREINKMRDAAEVVIENMDLDLVVDLSMKEVGIRGEGIKKGILHALATGNEGAGLTKWGLANSFTRAAQANELSYDTATDLERAGGDILELSPSAWKKVAC